MCNGKGRVDKEYEVIFTGKDKYKYEEELDIIIYIICILNSAEKLVR